jgi:hypothetical protein
MKFVPKIHASLQLLAPVLFCAILMAVGCQSPTVTHEQAQTVLASRIDLRQQLTLTKAQLDTTVAALNNINGKQTDDLVMSFNKFGTEVDQLDGAVAEVNRVSILSKAQAQTYFDTAATKISLIQDPELKSRATNRRLRALGLAQRIDDETKVVQESYGSFIQKLRDIQAYLAADLTTGAVQSIQDQFSQTNADVIPLKEKSDQLTFALELANELMNTGDVKPATTTTSEPTTESATYPSTTTESATPVPTTTTAP